MAHPQALRYCTQIYKWHFTFYVNKTWIIAVTWPRDPSSDLKIEPHIKADMSHDQANHSGLNS